MKIYITTHDLPLEDLGKMGAESLWSIDVSMLLAAGHTLTDVHDADIVINLNNHWINGPNVIMLSWEPNFYHHVKVCYKEPDLFHTVFRFGPCDAAKRSFPITQDPIAFPYYAYVPGPDRVRDDTALRGRRVFFAGVARYDDLPDDDGRRGLYAARTHLVRALQSEGVDVYAEGPGYGNDSREDGRIGTWDQIKLDLCRRVGADFHLCMENCQLENYISEKIHHGFQSDLVVLYLGNPDIHKYVPSEAFINLNEYYDPSRRRVNAAAVAHLLKNMTQAEYNAILGAARAWRGTAKLKERFGVQARRLTQVIVDRLAEVR